MTTCLPYGLVHNQSADELEAKFYKALNEGDERELLAFVENYQYKTYALVIDLLDDGLRSEFAGDVEDAHDSMAKAQRLASLYSEIFDMDCLVRRVGLYQRWSKTEKMRKQRADSLKSSGLEAYEKTDFQSALDLWSESLKIYIEIGDRRGEGSVLYRMGVVHSRRGQRREATRYSEQALRIEKAIHNITGEAYLYASAFFYSRIGQYETAIELYNRSLEIVREVGDMWQERRALNFIAWNYYILQEYEAAIAHLKRGLEIAVEMGHRRGKAISLCDLGLMYEHLELYDEALQSYSMALQIDEEIDHTFGTLSDLLGIGRVYKEIGECTQALTYYQRGLELALEIGTLDFIWKAQWHVGSVLEELGKDADALMFYRQSITTIESIRDQLEVEAFRTYFLIERPSVYNAIVDLLAKSGVCDEALEYAERARGHSLCHVITQGGLHFAQTQNQELLSARKTIEDRMKILNSRFVRGSPARTGRKDSVALADSLKMLRAEHRDLLRQIEIARYAQLNMSSTSEHLTVEEIRQGLLRAEECPVLVEYLVSEECTHVWAMTSSHLGYKRIDITEDQLERMVRDLVEPFQDLQSKKTRLLNIPFDLGLAYQLYLKIFNPVEEYFNKNATVIIIPDGVLYNLPFGALVRKIEPVDPNTHLFFSRYKSAQYLIEKYSISYAPSIGVLDAIAQRPVSKKRSPGQLLAFGNPNFKVSGSAWAFEPLPETGCEVESLSLFFKPPECMVFSELEAKEEHFKNKAPAYRYLHLATHSILDDTDPLYSKIVFSLDNDPEEDGFLEAYEVFDLKLHADLVVLSSCESALGKLSEGEGLIGLTRAFMYAGATSVLASLWSVGDPTARIMGCFYRNLKEGKSKAEALRQAKIQMICTCDERMSYAHPFLWAPFVLVGDWR